MENNKFQIPRKMFLILACLILMTITVLGVKKYDDTGFYLSAMQQIQGKTPLYSESQYTFQVIPMLNNPAIIIIAVLVGKIFGSELFGLFLTNLIFYIATAMIFYNLALVIFSDRKRALLASIFWAGNNVILRFGIGAYLVDMGGWLFYIAVLYLAVRFYRSQESKFAIMCGLVAAIGLFFKESGGIGILSLITFILLSPQSIRNKIILIIKSCLFFIINIAYHFWAYFTHGYLYFNRYETVLTNFAPHQKLINITKTAGYLFSIGWFLGLIGFFDGINKKIENIPDYRKIFYGLLPPAMIFLAYPAYDIRVISVTIPLLSIMAAAGLTRFKSKYFTYSIITLYVILNFLIAIKLSHPKI
ncbi:MAG: hypothetical protein CEN90_305 [Parcubacteria group bacterium Licking1014_17]|nr:MAG: hypothetical protein CEN90_305 [Parcubacteria group bacterium Licking1014_17]